MVSDIKKVYIVKSSAYDITHQAHQENRCAMHERIIKKVTIVGAGFVGATTAYTLMISGLISELVLIDLNIEKAEGEVMDLNHGMPFVRPVKIYRGSYEDCADSNIIIVSAGVSQKPGETRLDLVHNNAEVFKTVLDKVIEYNNDCILLVVTNPVDILTYVAYKYSGFPKNRVIGSGTVLDTARLRYLLSQHVGVDTRNIHAYIIGEHGDTEVAAWSRANIAGIPMDDYCVKCHCCEERISRRKIYEEVKNAAYEIINKKGATYYAVALAVRRIVEAIIRNENSVMTVSSLLEGQYGLSEVCLSVPSIVNSNGVESILEVPIDNTEKELLIKSGQTIKEVIKSLNI
jgi:L-lactate dehydrogenase